MLAKAALQPQSKTQRRCGYEHPAGPEANELKAIKNFTGQQCSENYRKKRSSLNDLIQIITKHDAGHHKTGIL